MRLDPADVLKKSPIAAEHSAPQPAAGADALAHTRIDKPWHLALENTGEGAGDWNPTITTEEIELAVRGLNHRPKKSLG